MPRDPHLVVVLVYPGVQLLDVSGPLDVLAAANDAGADYRTVVAAVDADDVAASAGLRLRPDLAFGDLDGPIDTLIVPGAAGWADEGRIPDALVAVVREAAARSARIASVCAGAFLLAEAGLLDGRRAATHWRFAERLRTRFPAVEVDADAIFVQDGTVFSSAGVTAGIDLCLALVEDDHGPTIAREVARELVVFLQRPGGQAQFSARLQAHATAQTPLRALLDGVAADPAGDHRVEALAERAGFSHRHLTRVFRRELDRTPAQYVEAIRLEAARELLETSDAPLATIARLSGLGSEETLRRTFHRVLGVPPHAYRQRFRTTAPQPSRAVA